MSFLPQVLSHAGADETTCLPFFTPLLHLGIKAPALDERTGVGCVGNGGSTKVMDELLGERWSV